VGPLTVAQQPVSLGIGPGGIWVGSVLGGTVSVLDQRSGAVRASAALPDGVSRLVVGGGAVWVVGQQSSLVRVDPDPVGLLLRWRSTLVGRGPVDVAIGAGAAWVADGQSSSITRVDAGSLRVTGTWHLPDGHGGVVQPSAVASFDHRVWVADAIHDTVTALDPGTVSLPGPIRQLAVGDGSLWAVTSYPGAIVRIDPA
jgi:DNA-binding beta-propeller fold protein YncE